jgi:hypothetical protein
MRSVLACRQRKISESRSYIETSIKVITFSRKKKDWISWEEKFLAKSKRQGYKEILLGKVEVLKSTDIFDPAIDEDKIRDLTSREEQTRLR